MILTSHRMAFHFDGPKHTHVHHMHIIIRSQLIKILKWSNKTISTSSHANWWFCYAVYCLTCHNLFALYNRDLTSLVTLLLVLLFSMRISSPNETRTKRNHSSQQQQQQQYAYNGLQNSIEKRTARVCKRHS